MRTSDKICKLRKEHPEWVLDKIVEKTGVSRQYVWKVLKDANLKTSSIFFKNRPQNRCKDCGIECGTASTCGSHKRKKVMLVFKCHYPDCNNMKTISAAQMKWRREKMGYVHFYCSYDCVHKGRKLGLS